MPNTKLWLGIIACATLIGLVAWWIAPGAKEIEIPIASSRTDLVDGHERANRVMLEADASNSDERSNALVSNASSVAGMRVLVVEKSSGRPIAGALVHCGEPTAPSLYDPHHPLVWPEFEQALAKIGEKFTTDAHGEALVPRPRNQSLVDARSGNAWGFNWIHKDAVQPIRIELVIDRELVLQVVDASGRPVAGVPVGLSPGPGATWRDDVWIGSSRAPDGLARLRQFDQTLAPTLKTHKVCAHIAIVARDLEMTPIDPDHLPTEPVRLTLPPTGSVDLVLSSEDRGAVDPTNVHIADASELDSQDALEWGMRTSRPSEINNGHALFPFVGLGLELYADGTADDFEMSHVMGPGPRHAGETVQLALDFGKANPVLVGRLIDEHSDPLVELDVSVNLNVHRADGGTASVNRSVETDSRGAFHLALPISTAPGLSGTLSVHATLPGMEEGAQAYVQLPSEIHAGDNALGDIVVRAPEIVLSGMVVVEGDVPVPNALVTAEEQGRPGSERLQFGKLCDAQGKFTMRGQKPDGMLLVRARRDGFGSPPGVSVRPGARGLRIVLTGGATLAGALLVDAGVPLREIEVYLKRTDRPLPRRPGGDIHDSGRVLPNGAFTFASLAPGVADLVVRHRSLGELVTLDNVRLRAGEKADDPRLQAIDLRGKLHPLRIDVVDEDEKPVKRGDVACYVDGKPSVGAEFRDGTTVIVIRATSCGLDVEADGFRPVHLANVSSDQRVTLKRGIPVRLRWSGATALPRAPIELGVVLVSRDAQRSSTEQVPTGHALSTRTEEHWFGSDGELSIDLPIPGTYEVYWTLKKNSGQEPATSSVKELTPMRLTILDSPIEQVFEVAPDSVRLSEALRSFD